MSNDSMQYREFLKTAAFLRREFMGTELESEASLENIPRNVIYTFDSNVIVSKCAPWITGPANVDHLSGFGEIFTGSNRVPPKENQNRDFEQDPAKKAELIAELLAEYALKLPRGTIFGSIFQLPSHFNETNNIYQAVRRKVLRLDSIGTHASNTRYNFRVRRSLALLQYLIKNSDKYDLKNFRSLTSNIVNLLAYQDDEPGARYRALKEWDEYCRIESYFGGIFDVRGACNKERPDLERYFAALDYSRRTLKQEEMRQNLVNYWSNLFSGSRRRNFTVDAEAIADLFLLNASFIHANWTCLFVTGDRYLVEKMYQNPIPLDIVPEEFRPLATTFTLRHVRHLWAYSGEAFIEKAEFKSYNPEVKVLGLFDGLLAKWSGSQGFNAQSLEKIVLGKIDVGEVSEMADASVALADWQALTERALAEYSSRKYEKISGLQDSLNFMANEFAKEDWSTLISKLTEEVARFRDRAVLSSSDLGLDPILIFPEDTRRCPPDLQFESLMHTNGILSRLGRQGGFANRSEFESAFETISSDCYISLTEIDDRQECHLKFLVLGAAFASVEKWHVAYGHARRAAGIIERTKTRGNTKIPVLAAKNGDLVTNMSGREAYFLSAISQRMLATSPRDLEVSREFLFKARQALLEDQYRGTAKSMSPDRFSVEDLSRTLALYYMRRTENTEDYQDGLASDVFRSLGDLLHLLLLNENGELSYQVSSVTQLNLAANLIQVGLISRFRIFRSRDHHTAQVVPAELLQVAVDIIGTTTDAFELYRPEAVFSSQVVRCYGNVGRFILLHESGIEPRPSLNNLRMILEDARQNPVTCYDAWRYGALIEFLEEFYRV